MGIHYNIIPVTTGDFTHTLHKYDVLPEYTKNTRSYIMTYTGHDRRLYYWYRSLSYPAKSSFVVVLSKKWFVTTSRLVVWTSRLVVWTRRLAVWTSRFVTTSRWSIKILIFTWIHIPYTCTFKWIDFLTMAWNVVLEKLERKIWK